MHTNLKTTRFWILSHASFKASKCQRIQDTNNQILYSFEEGPGRADIWSCMLIMTVASACMESLQRLNQWLNVYVGLQNPPLGRKNRVRQEVNHGKVTDRLPKRSLKVLSFASETTKKHISTLPVAWPLDFRLRLDQLGGHFVQAPLASLIADPKDFTFPKQKISLKCPEICLKSPKSTTPEQQKNKNKQIGSIQFQIQMMSIIFSDGSISQRRPAVDHTGWSKAHW